MGDRDSDIDPEFALRAHKATEALRAHPAVAYANVSLPFQDIWAGLKTDTTQELESIEQLFGLTNPIVTLNYTVEHGIVLDIWWNFTDSAEPLPDDKTYDDYINALENEDVWGDYLEDTLSNPPEDSGFDMMPEQVPNTIPRDDSFPLSPPGWNYAGSQWLQDEHTDETGFTSAALYFCHFQSNIAKLWILYDQDEDLYHLDLVEYPTGESMIAFKTTHSKLHDELHDTARAWLQSQNATHLLSTQNDDRDGF